MALVLGDGVVDLADDDGGGNGGRAQLQQLILVLECVVPGVLWVAVDVDAEERDHEHQQQDHDDHLSDRQLREDLADL